MVELERQARNIQEKVLKDLMPRDIQYITKKQRTVIEQWCGKVPVVGF